MKKFTCGHCGGRIAVTPKHLGKLVVCPECGKATHPLAADILAAAAPPPTPPRSFSGELLSRACENCARQIGRLEPLQVWNNHLVCPDCYTQLSGPTSEPKPSRNRRTKPKAESLPLPAQTQQSSLPVVIERAELAAPRREPAAGMSFDPASVRVAVGRVTSAASTVASLPPLQLKHRFLILMGVICFAGVAIYGALTLLRDLAGLITTIALILLAATAVVALIGTGLNLIARWRALRAKPQTPSQAIEPARQISSGE